MIDVDIEYVEDHRRPEEIEDDLERTRAEVSSTIDAIQSKLTPGQLMDQAFAYARTSLPADFGANLANTVRDNPVPVTLMGVGIAWLMMSGRHAEGRTRMRRTAYDDDIDHSYSEPYADTGGMQGDKLRHMTESISEKGSEWRAQAERAGRSARDKASDLGHRVSDTASTVSERVRSAGYQTRERVNQIGQRSQEQYYRAKDGVNRMVDEQPLMVGVLGLAMGALLGAMLPGTRREDEMMGRTRDDLLDKARDTVGEQAEQLKRSAMHVADVAKNEAQSMAENMTSRTENDARTDDARSAPSTSNTASSAGRPQVTTPNKAQTEARTEYETVTGEETHV